MDQSWYKILILSYPIGFSEIPTPFLYKHKKLSPIEDKSLYLSIENGFVGFSKIKNKYYI